MEFWQETFIYAYYRFNLILTFQTQDFNLKIEGQAAVVNGSFAGITKCRFIYTLVISNQSYYSTKKDIYTYNFL